jgi:glycosyltransferase involved in cell wall biosynthesis
LYGEYDLAELPCLLSGADCVIVPSQLPETFSLCTHEALALGIPVVASRLGALPEAIVENENGMTFGHDRPEELAAILKKLANEPLLLTRWRKGAARSRCHILAEHAAAMERIYAEAVDDARHGTMNRSCFLENLQVLEEMLRPVCAA